MATSLVTATTFQLAHCVEEADFTSAEQLDARASASGRCTRSRRPSTSARATPVLTWMLGGLNYQIEHHLFPRVPHTHYPRIAEIVRRNAAKHGVRYTAQPSLWARASLAPPPPAPLGRLGVPVEIEMG